MSDGCADVEPLHCAWIDGALEAEERTRVGGHLRECPSCRGEVESLQRTRARMRSLPVRRIPAEVGVVPAAAGGSLRPRTVPPRGVVHRGRQRLTAGLAIVMALIGGAAFALGGQPSPDDRMVTVPVDLFVADHLVHTVGGPMSTPVVVEGRR